MNDYAKTLAKMKKTSKLIRLHQHQNGPKSYKRGQGALLRALLEADGIATQRELTVILGVNRKMLKDIVRKAQRNDYVTIEDAEGKKTYAVKLTDVGREVAEKHEKAQDKLAEQILATLTDDERAQLDAINEKLIIACKEAGIDGKKKGHKAHKHGHRHGHKGCCKHHGRH